MKMRTRYALSLAVLFAGCLVSASLLAAFCADTESVAATTIREKGWGTVSGVLVWVQASNSRQLQDRQLVLVDSDGGMTVLIGEQVNKLLESVGSNVVVTGVYKPAMTIKGTRTSVLEVRFIDRIDNKEVKDEKTP